MNWSALKLCICWMVTIVETDGSGILSSAISVSAACRKSAICSIHIQYTCTFMGIVADYDPLLYICQVSSYKHKRIEKLVANENMNVHFWRVWSLPPFASPKLMGRQTITNSTVQLMLKHAKKFGLPQIPLTWSFSSDSELVTWSCVWN